VPKSVRDILLLNLSPATVFDNRETQPDPTSLTVFYFPENKKKKMSGVVVFLFLKSGVMRLDISQISEPLQTKTPATKPTSERLLIFGFLGDLKKRV